MVRINSMTVVFILFFFITALVFPQKTESDPVEKLREEILAVYQSKGDQGLRDFFKKEKDKITNKFIVDFAEAGLRGREEVWLKICKIIAEDKEDGKILADVLYITGIYFILIDNKKAADYLDKALPIYIRLNDPVSQGKVYMGKGDIYSAISEYIKASEMFNKALVFFEKAGDIINQGNVYKKKGDIHFYMDDFSKALMMYDKALQFFEKKGYFQGKGNVYFKLGDIHFYSGENSLALEMYDTALDIFKKEGDLIGQANIYWRKGDSYFYNGNNSMALEMYAKALYFYKKMKYPLGQGNAYKGQGNVYLHTGDNSNALKMYTKALYFFEKVGELLGQGNVHKSIGDIFFIKGDTSRAKEKYDMALYFYEKAKSLISLGTIYSKKGYIFFINGDNAKALAMYDRALAFSEKAGDPRTQGVVYHNKGDVYLQIGNNSSALEMYDKSLQFLDRAGDLSGKGKVYLAKAQLYYYTGNNEMAERMCDKAFPIIKKSLDIGDQVNFYILKGNIYINTGQIKNAEKMFDKVLSFLKKNSIHPINLGNVFLGKGNVYFFMGEFSKALQMYDKSIFFYTITTYHLGLGNVYRYKGDIFLYSSLTLKALEMYNRALSSFSMVKEPRGLGSIYLRKGDVYLKSGSMSRARDMYKKALPFFEKTGDLQDQGNINMQMGETFFYTGEDSTALKMYEKAILFYKESNDIRGQGIVYIRKGDIFFRIGKYREALEMYEKAIPHFENSGARTNLATAFRGIGDINFRNAEYSKALEMYEKALALDTQIGDLASESTTLGRKARLFAKQELNSVAKALYEKAISNTEKVRHQTASSEMKRKFLDQVYNQYEEAALFMLENKYYKKGFQYAESMKSRVFLDRMTEELVQLEKGLALDLKEKRDNLVGKLSSLNKQIYEAAGGKNEEKLQELREQYRKTEDEFDELLIKIRLENPRYTSVRYPQPITTQELQQDALKKDEILVRYFISPDKLYVFLVSKKKFKVVPLEVTKEEIKRLVEEHLRAVRDNDSIRMKRYGKILYEKLLKPLEKRIKKSENIIIVPDRELATIPFESLIVDNKGQDRPVFLLEKYRVKYMQSASLLKILRQHYQNNRETNNFIGFGDPVYDYENFKQGKPEQGSTKILATESTENTESIFSHEDTRSDTKEKSPSSVPSVSSVAIPSPQAFGDEIKEIYRSRYARAGGIMDRLQASGEEVKTIARLFEKKSQKSVIHLRDEATEDNAGAPGMKDFDYIHFTCHGLLNDDFQSLVLSQLPPDKSKEDGYFTLNEIMNCDYNAKLVVLSACQTGSGKMERAEGVTGMTRAVMYAGTPAVVATLWKVDDEATKELMVKFYENMLEKNLDKAEALRQAKLELIKNKKYRSPLFWSAFVMYGE